MEVMNRQPPRHYAKIRPREPRPGDPVSPREVECLDLLLEGLSNKLIAAKLGISEHTAKYYIHQGLAKLGAPGSRVRGAVLWERRRCAAVADHA